MKSEIIQQKGNSLKKKLFKIDNFSFVILIVSFILTTVGSIGELRSKNKNRKKSFLSVRTAGYFLSAISLFFISFTVVSYGSISEMFFDSLPIYMTSFVNLFVGIQTLVYQNKLINNKVANEYYNWTISLFILLIIQMIMIVYNMHSNNVLYKYIIYLLGIFNFVILGINQTILQFYSTDG